MVSIIWIRENNLNLRKKHTTAYLDKDPPTDDSKEQWMERDARLYL